MTDYKITINAFNYKIGDEFSTANLTNLINLNYFQLSKQNMNIQIYLHY